MNTKATDTQQAYYNAEFLAYAPLTLESCGIIRLKLRSEKGETKWLNLTPTQARAIESIISPHSASQTDLGR